MQIFSYPRCTCKKIAFTLNPKSPHRVNPAYCVANSEKNMFIRFRNGASRRKLCCLTAETLNESGFVGESVAVNQGTARAGTTCCSCVESDATASLALHIWNSEAQVFNEKMSLTHTLSCRPKQTLVDDGTLISTHMSFHVYVLTHVWACILRCPLVTGLAAATVSDSTITVCTLQSKS